MPRMYSIREGLVILSTLFLTTFNGAIAQPDSLRQMEAVRIEGKPEIDGKLDEAIWQNANPFEGHFYQLSPDNGSSASYKTKVMVVYNNSAIYVGAIMYDPDPESIPKELGIRDDLERNADNFGLIIDPYDKGQNAFTYATTVTDVQADALMTTDDFDTNWDAVWKSKVNITSEGWVAEFEIPYSAIRFPKKDRQTWGLNFFRASKRNNEESTWNFVDQEQEGFINQSGKLTGLENIKPPLRLSFTPYLSTIASHDGASGKMTTNIAGGLDLKYGINESFTLDMSLIPDFSQVQSDNEVLNLSPFEVRFDENRPFFTEGLELFSKGRIFYSRRVGKSFGDVDESTLLPDEEIQSIPAIAPMINATKISGRTGSGTGIGFFNALTNKTYATIKNIEDGSNRKILVDPITNFNVVVIDQNLKNNSNVGIINTNVWRKGDAPDANVTLADFQLRDKSNTWNISGKGGLSQVFTTDSNDRTTKTGFKSGLSVGKVSGKIQFNTSFNLETDTWDINDLGFSRVANRVTYRSNISYNVFKPFKIFNRFRVNLWGQYNRLYKPSVFTNTNIGINANTQFKNFQSSGFGIRVNPGNNYDYYEPRVDGRFFKSGPNFNYHVFYGTDDRKPFSVGGYVGQWHRPSDNAGSVFGGVNPRYRVNNKLSLDIDFTIQNTHDAKGYVATEYDEAGMIDNIVFGLRDQATYVNVLGVNYTFNNKMGLSFRMRHYWSWVEYSQYFDLTEGGELIDSNYDGFDQDGTSIHNTSFNAFNIDMVYSWQIAPGSFVSAVWKNSITTFEEEVGKNFFENFGATMKNPAVNQISVKLIYYIDSAYLRKK